MQEWLTNTLGKLNELFAEKPIVFVDIGASGTPPAAWRALAAISSYIGFDPDQRALREDNSYGFLRFIMVNKAVTDVESQEVEFYLTASPYCSSTLKPNLETLAHYEFTDRFRVEKSTQVSAVRLDTALRSVGLDYIDWLKLDSQGKDLDIYRSLNASTSSHILVLDIEPGIMDFYKGENTFAPAHVYLLESGFWLSKVHLQQYARISKSTREILASRNIPLQKLPGSPTAVEATYYRTIEHLLSVEADLRDSACLWVFSMLSGTYGFALDIAVHIIGRGLNDSIGGLLLQETLAEIERYAQTQRKTRLQLLYAQMQRKTRLQLLSSIAKAGLPQALHPYARKVLALLSRQ
jgi:FkbM family methyltransferase